MKYTLLIIFMLFSHSAYAECEWTERHPIRNNNKLFFQVCNESKSIKINESEVTPNIPFELIFPDCPECNSIWSILSPDNKTAVVYIENMRYERNAWVLDLASGEIVLFTDTSNGKHFLVTFSDNNNFTITHAGMGYRTDYYYTNKGGEWRNIGHEEIKIEWP